MRCWSLLYALLTDLFLLDNAKSNSQVTKKIQRNAHLLEPWYNRAFCTEHTSETLL